MKPKTKLLLGLFLTALFLAIMGFLFLRDNSQTIAQGQLQTLLANASKFKIDENYLYFYNKGKEYRLLKDEKTLAQIKEQYPIETKMSPLWILAILIPILSLIAFFLLKKRRASATNPTTISSSSPAAKPLEISPAIAPSNPSSHISLDSLAGLSEIKSQILELIDYLKSPRKYQALGLKMPKGILLVGPPGVGKTMLAKALASEAGVPFFYQSGSSFAQIFVGSGAKKVQELFKEAKAFPQAIIFIDEIDSVGKMRGEGRNDEREATLNQLLTEMDGFSPSSNLIVLGATNNAQVLDPALLRSGRFDRKLYIDLPTLQERVEIFTLYLKDKPHKLCIQDLARDCAGFSPAMIATLINESGLLMLRHQDKSIEPRHIQEAKSALLFSLKKLPTLSQKDREILALYQSAKAFYAHKSGIHFEKIALWDEESIYSFPELSSRSQILSRIAFHLSGNEALNLFYGESYSCARQDLKQAKCLAQEFLCELGMGAELFASDPSPIIQEAKSQLLPLLQSHQGSISRLCDLMLANENLSPDDL